MIISTRHLIDKIMAMETSPDFSGNALSEIFENALKIFAHPWTFPENAPETDDSEIDGVVTPYELCEQCKGIVATFTMGTFMNNDAVVRGPKEHRTSYAYLRTSAEDGYHHCVVFTASIHTSIVLNDEQLVLLYPWKPRTRQRSCEIMRLQWRRPESDTKVSEISMHRHHGTVAVEQYKAVRAAQDDDSLEFRTQWCKTAAAPFILRCYTSGGCIALIIARLAASSSVTPNQLVFWISKPFRTR